MAYHAAGSKMRLRVAAQWVYTVSLPEHSHLPGLEVCKAAVSLLPRHVMLTPKMRSQHRVISSLSVYAVECGELKLAVEMLNQGRANVLSEMSEYRSSINKLHELDDEAAESLDELDHELESTALSSVDAAATVSDAETVRCRTPDEEREELLSIVRHVSGFTNCLKSVLFRDLQMAAPGRPVVIVNISSYRSDAIIITQASPPELIPLPRITPSEKDRISSTLEKALKIKGKDRYSGVAEVLRFLWNGIVVQVVERLKEQKLHLGSRIWWCPTPKLCALPIHVAGIYRDGNGGSGLPDL